MKIIKEFGTTIIPLDKCPYYAPICAHWAYSQWFLQRDIAFDVNLLSYRQKAANELLPRVFVACVDSLPVGMVSLKERDIWKRPDIGPWLSSLYVVPEFRKKGIGGMLIKFVIDEAASRGFEELFLFLDQNEMPRLAPFYEKRGWHYVSDEKDNDDALTKIYRFPARR